MEKARHKANIIKNKFKRSAQIRFDKNYSKRNPPQSANTGTSRYTPLHLREGSKPNLEAQTVREGKCKCCGEKWDPKHRCLHKSNPQKLYVCEAEEEEKDSESEESSEDDMGNQQGCHSELEDDTPKISLATITRISQPQTLKLKGDIKNNNVSILIDVGSTHNCINVNLAKIFNLFVFPMPNMKVMVAYGKKIENEGKCHKVKFQMQE